MKSLKAKFRKSDTNEWSKYDDRLLQAVDHGEVDKVSSLLGKKGVVATKMDSEGKTAFHLAAAKGNVDCLRVILTHGIDVSAQDLSGHSALHLAVRNNHIECVKRLLQSKCPVDSTDNAGKSPMHYAAANGCVASVQILCDQKCPINIKDLEENTPLLVAVLHGHIEVCKYLLDHRADINVKDANGRTSLMLACESTNFNMVDMLVRHGADLRLTDSLGHDALHFSRLSGNSQIINLLVSKMSQEPGIVSPTKPMQHDQVTKLSTERSGTPKKRKAPPPPPITPLQSDVSSPRSSISTPMSAKGQVFFPDQGGKDEITSSNREFRDRLSDSTGADSLLDESSEAEHQEAIALLQAKIVSLTSQNKELQEKLQAKMNNETVMDISCDSYHSTQADLNLSNVSTQESTSPTVISENTDISFESQPEASISEDKLRQLEKTIDDMQLKLNESEAEREMLEAQIQSMSLRLQQSINVASLEDGSDLEVQPYGEEEDERQDKKQKANLQRMSHVEQEGMSEESHQETLLMLEELDTLRRNYKNILSESDRKDNEMKELQYQVEIMTATMANMLTLEKLKEVEKSYISLIEQINQEKTQLRDTYEEELEDMKKLQKELESRMEKASSDEDKEAMVKTIEELNKQVSELSLAYREAQAELGKARENAQEVSCDFIRKEEHVKLLQEVIEVKQQVENDFTGIASQHAQALEEIGELKQLLQEEKRNSPEVAEYMQVIATLRDTTCSLEAERNELRVCLSSQESKLRALEEDVLHEKTVVQETMVTRKVFEELQASLEAEIFTLSSEIRNLLKEKEKLSNERAEVKLELTQVKGDRDLILSQLNTRELEINDYRIRYDKAQEDLLELKRFSENTSKIEEDKDKKINELSKEVSKLKEALNSLSQLSLSTSTPKRQSQQLEALQQQVKQLQSQQIETKKQHQEIVSVYRMHLLYAVQGQMDEDVQKVLKQILMMCKSQPQKM